MVAAKSKAARSRAGEFAPAGGERDINAGYRRPQTILPYYDPILNKSHEYSLLNRGQQNMKLYDSIAKDDQVRAGNSQLFHKIVAAPWAVEPGGERRKDVQAADNLRMQLERINFNNLIEKAAWADFYGYSISEVIYEPNKTRPGEPPIDLAAIKVRNRRRFRVNAAMDWRLLTFRNSIEGEALPDRKFWSFTVGSTDDDNPYGQGTAGWLYYPVFFKSTGWRYWAKYLEKYGRPTAVVDYPEGSEEDVIEEALRIALSLGDYDGVAKSENLTAGFMEATRTGQPGYENFVDALNSAISKIINGQTMTTDEGSSLSQAEVHQNTQLAIAKSLSDIIHESFSNTVAKWITDLNYPGAAYPKVTRDLDPSENQLEKAQKDKVLFDMGFIPSLDYVQREYGEGFGIPEDGQSTGLNGAQVAAIVDIMTQVSSGNITASAGRQLATLTVPTLSEEQAALLIEEPPEREPVTPITPEGEEAEEEAEEASEFEGEPDTVRDYADRMRKEAGPEIDTWVDQIKERLSNAESLAEFSDTLSDLYSVLDGDQVREIASDAITASAIAGSREDLSEDGEDDDLPENNNENT